MRTEQKNYQIEYQEEANTMPLLWDQRSRRTVVLVVSTMVFGLPSMAVGQDLSATLNEDTIVREAVSHEQDRARAKEGKRDFVIEGNCTDGSNAPMSGVTLHLFVSESDRDLAPQFVSEATTGEQGKFRFIDLKPPRLSPSASEPRRVYHLVATSPGKATSLQHIASSRRLAPCHMVFLNSRTVQGRVTDAIGNPIEGATVSTSKEAFYRRLGGDIRHEALDVKTDAEGSYQMGDVPDFDATQLDDAARRTVPNSQPARQQLIVEHPDYGRQAFTIPNSSATLDIVLTRLAFLEGRVIDGLTQMPVPGVSLLVEQSSEAPIRVASDRDGMFRRAVPPGTYTIRSTNSPPHTHVAARTFGVVSGDNPLLEVELVTDGILEGRVIDSRGRPIAKTDIARLRIGIKEANEPSRPAATRSVAVEDDGTYRMPVPPGENYPFVFSNRPIPRHFIADREPETAHENHSVTVGSGETVKLDFFIEPL